MLSWVSYFSLGILCYFFSARETFSRRLGIQVSLEGEEDFRRQLYWDCRPGISVEFVGTWLESRVLEMLVRN